MSLSHPISQPVGRLHWLLARAGPGLETASFLLPEELADGERYRHPGRHRQWRLGRAAAKLLLLRWQGEPWSTAAARRFCIRREEAGWPRVFDAAGQPLPVSLSISHSGERAFCALGEEAAGPLGADLEAIETRSAAFLEDFYGDGERQILSKLSGREHDIAVNAIWSLKEALLKAARSGLRRRATDAEVISLARPGADGWSQAVARINGAEKCWGAWRLSRDGRHVLALARCVF